MIRVGSYSLRKRTVRFADGRLRRTTLFPLFDGDGTVHAVLLVTPATGMLRLVPPDRIRAGLGQPRVLARLADVPSLTSGAFEPYADLWHSDPEWLLDKPGFTGHPQVPALKRGNVAWTTTFYTWRLERVTGRTIGEETRRFRPGELDLRVPPHPADAVAPRADRGGWRLAPMWDRAWPGRAGL